MKRIFPKHFSPQPENVSEQKQDTFADGYRRGKADAYIGIINAAKDISPERGREEVSAIRSSLMDVMPHEYHDHIKHLSSANQTITNNYNMEYNKYNNCTIGAVNESNGTVHVHMDGKKEPAYEEFQYAEVMENEQDKSLSTEQNARNWAYCHFNEINSIYTSWEALANKAANICSLYEAEKARHDEGDRWRTTFFRNHFYPKESHRQWLRDKNMTHAIFMELILDERADKDVLANAKKGYKFIGLKD